MRHGYDEKCGDLAKEFLADEPRMGTKEDVDSLAQTIQDAIEDWLAENRR